MNDTQTAPNDPSTVAPRPFGLLAEVTYRCPLHCPYCSNPTKFPPANAELTTDEWERVLNEAAELGTLHALFSGGEPLARTDLPQLIAAARAAGLYTNLITSGVGFTEARANAIAAAGLDSIQISFQAHEATLGDLIAGAEVHKRKLTAAALARSVGLPLSLNVVIHRGNIAHVGDLIRLAEELGAERLELANTQFYGWAFLNRSTLIPTRAQLDAASVTVKVEQGRLRGKMRILHVLPDYYATRPKPCMNGWGQRYLTVNPVGDVLPCPTATEIKSMRFDNVRDHSLRWIWTSSDSFNRFRGFEWMPEPCRNCELHEIDFGGCRCQAALLTGDAANTDPACELAPHRWLLTDFISAAQELNPDLSERPSSNAAATPYIMRVSP